MSSYSKADIVGTYSPLSDAEILSLVYKAYTALGLKIKIIINDRKQLNDIEDKYLNSIDKVGKVPEQKIIEELESKGMSVEEAEATFNRIRNLPKPDSIKEIESLFERMGNPKEALSYVSVLVRGLDYYTGLIFEVLLENQENTLSLGGGGRYDNLIGMFAGRDIPAVGFAFGFDRLMEAMEVLNLFPTTFYTSKVLVAFAKSELQEKALKISDELRNKKINAEVYLEDVNLEKQLKYADKKQIPFVVIVDEDKLALKNMVERSQEELEIDQIIDKLQK